jgi:hypothetical protein
MLSNIRIFLSRFGISQSSLGVVGVGSFISSIMRCDDDVKAGLQHLGHA